MTSNRSEGRYAERAAELGRPLRILSLDPGGTTGTALATLSGSGAVGDWSHCEIGPEEHHADLREFISAHSPDVLVYERFDYRPGLQRADLISREYIGIIKLLAGDVGAELWAQSAGDGKGFVTDDKLKKSGLWVEGSAHCRDAYRHLVFWLVMRAGIKKGIVDSWLPDRK